MTCGDNISTENPLTTTTEYTTISSSTNAEVSSTTQSVTTDLTTSANTQTSTEAPSTSDTTTEVHTPTQTVTTDSPTSDITQTTTEVPTTTQSVTTDSPTSDITQTTTNVPKTAQSINTKSETTSSTTNIVNTPTQSIATDSSSVSILARKKRNLPSYRFYKKSTDAVQYKCFSLQHAGDNNRRVTKRGCVKFQENVATTCDNAIGKGNVFDQCVLCEKDRCNFGNSLTVSVLTLTTSILILLFRL